jgi:photosystem II stability/assembly factor-like uncharacterized protein
LYVTSDGGVSWRQIPALPTIPGTAGWVRSVAFLSYQTGFVIGSQLDYDQGRDVLLETQDGGKTWQDLFNAPSPAPWPDGPFQIAADGRGIGFESATTGSEQQDSLLFTADSGKTWTSQGPILRSAACESGYESVTSLSAPDPNTFWATLACASNPMATILSSQDGGKSWKESSVPGKPGDGWVDITFPTDQTGYLVSQAGLLYKTVDGGTGFSLADPQAVHTRSLRFVNMGTPPSGTDLRGWEVRGATLYEEGGTPIPFPLPVLFFAYLPDNSGWLVSGQASSGNGGSPRLFSTSDGGKSWVEHSFGNLQTNASAPDLDCIQFSDVNHGWLRAGSAFYYTGDGGRSWTQYH